VLVVLMLVLALVLVLVLVLGAGSEHWCGASGDRYNAHTCATEPEPRP
jgi:hypothetical protein